MVHDLYKYTVYNVSVVMNINDNHVGILVSTFLLCFNSFILHVQPTFNVRSSK